jgi:predicted  nucleic acid-binding Zn-ribbon protein
MSGRSYTYVEYRKRKEAVEHARKEDGFFDHTSECNSQSDLDCSWCPYEKMTDKERIQKLENQIQWLLKKMYYLGAITDDLKYEIDENLEIFQDSENDAVQRVRELDETLDNVQSRVSELEDEINES